MKACVKVWIRNRKQTMTNVSFSTTKLKSKQNTKTAKQDYETIYRLRTAIGVKEKLKRIEKQNKKTKMKKSRVSI